MMAVAAGAKPYGGPSVVPYVTAAALPASELERAFGTSAFTSPPVDKVPTSFSSMERMRHVSLFILLGVAGALSLLTGCQTGRVTAGKPYHVTAYRPHHPPAVRVRVSLSRPNVDVMGGDRHFLSAAIALGIPGKPPPRADCTI